jgi:hypothetical protein
MLPHRSSHRKPFVAAPSCSASSTSLFLLPAALPCTITHSETHLPCTTTHSEASPSQPNTDAAPNPIVFCLPEINPTNPIRGTSSASSTEMAFFLRARPQVEFFHSCVARGHTSLFRHGLGSSPSWPPQDRASAPAKAGALPLVPHTCRRPDGCSKTEDQLIYVPFARARCVRLPPPYRLSSHLVNFWARDNRHGHLQGGGAPSGRLPPVAPQTGGPPAARSWAACSAPPGPGPAPPPTPQQHAAPAPAGQRGWGWLHALRRVQRRWQYAGGAVCWRLPAWMEAGI